MSENKAEYGTETAVAVRGEVLSMVERAQAMVVASEADRETMMDIVREAKRRSAKWLAFMADVCDGAFKAHKTACAKRAEIADPLKELEKIGKKKCEDFDREQARARAEEERKAREEEAAIAERERQRLLREADRRKTDEAKQRLIEQAEAIVAAPVDLPPEPPKREGESYATSYEVEIIDAGAVPREYCLIDLQALRKVGNATKGKLAIPGVRWIEKKTLRVRV
jgi:hypothetical protein